MAIPRPYSPSWVDRFTDWIDCLPGSYWLYYSGLGIFIFLLQTIVLWIDSAAPVGTFLHAHAYLSAAIALLLAMISYFDKRASLAFSSMRPVLCLEEDVINEFKFRLTTLPLGQTFLASFAIPVIIFIVEYYGEPYQVEILDMFPISANLLYVVYLISWFVFGTYLFHTVRQLRLINLIYTKYTKINIFDKKPLYGFSNLSALTAGVLTMVALGWLWVNPSVEINHPYVLIAYILILALSLTTFIWPQLGIHSLQTSELDRLLVEGYKRYEHTVIELHKRLDSHEYDQMGEINTALNNLEMELDMLKKVSTWPWEPETVRLLISALALPLGLWIIQFILQSVLSQ